jgi:hypothetical protein
MAPLETPRPAMASAMSRLRLRPSVPRGRCSQKLIVPPAVPFTIAAVMVPNRAKWLVVALAFLLPLTFAAFTGHAWEDYFITLRSSRNLIEGHGLVFNPGERVHTFTSPLGVLVPALCTWVAGVTHEQAALWFFRLINATLLAAAVLLVWRRADTLGLGKIGRVLFFGLMLADAKLTDFAINGMETAMLVFFALLLWTELEAPAGPRAGRVAVALGGLMWTRPDAFILAGVLLLSQVCFRPRLGGESGTRQAWSELARGIAFGALLYLPWFIWAWWYYGSPVPHTIIAKAAYTPPVHLQGLLLLPWHVLTGQSMILDLFLPSYWVFGGWPPLLIRFAHLLMVIAAFGWLVPGWSAVGRRLSFTVFLGMFYLTSIILFPWYSPPWTMLAALAVAFAVDRIYVSPAVASRAWLKAGVRITCGLILLLQAGMWVASAWQMRVQQTVVENGARRPVGEWLRQHAVPGDTVFLEPLGYIGYYSELKTYDFPGLSSPEVVAAVRGGAKSYSALIAKLQPKWVVLRPAEAARPEFRQRPVLRDYELVQSWDVLAQLDAIAVLPGRSWNEFEARYLLYRRRPPVPAGR